MNTHIERTLFVLALFAGLHRAAAQGTAFTYQGHLLANGAPANGNYDLSFTAYDDSVAGNLVSGPVTQAPVTVSDGTFNVVVDLGDGTFTGQRIWLEIGVRTNGSADAYAVLTPRQEMLPAPYAIYSEQSGWAAITPEAVQANTVIAGAVAAPQLATSAAPTGGQVLSFDGTGLVWVNSSIVGGSGWGLTGNGGTVSGVNFLGTTDDEPLTLRANNQNGFQLQYAERSGFPLGSSVYSMNVLGGWWGNEILNNSIGATIAGGGEHYASLGDNGDYPNVVSGDFGAVGGGYGNTAGNFGVVPGGAFNSAGGAFSFAAGYRASAPNSGSFVWADSSSGTFSSTANNQFLIRAAGGVGIGTSSPQESLTIGGVTSYNNGLKITGSTVVGTGLALENTSTGGHKYDLISTGSADGPLAGALGIYDETVGAYRFIIGTDGTVSVNVLTITGGSDLAEPFKLAGDSIPKGAVLVIDEDHPGELKLSTAAYDTHVAGIVSGANGINPGIALRQEGFSDGGQNVALSGRVYVQADASYGAIKPGDLLTTSDTPGYAMKVTDHSRAQGAILGKAMSRLREGQGLVLVLVSLQ
jgi:hypothetical protein